MVTRRHRADERGAISLEAAVVVPVLLLIIFGTIQGALYYHARTVALAAAQEGVRVARSEDGSAPAGAAAAQEFLSGAGGTSILERVGVRPVRTATEAEVTVTGVAPLIVPGMPGLPVSQTASGPVERFTTPGE